MYPTRHHTHRPLRRRVLTGAISALALAAPVQAAQFIYTPTNGLADLWSAGTDWTAAPLSAVDTRLTFVGTNTDVFADGLVNVNTDDVAGSFQLNLLDLQGTGSASGGATVTIASAAPATGLTLVSNGATTPIVNLNALAGTSGLTYDVTAPVTLANNTLFTGNGTAAFRFSGGLAGSTATLTKSGTSTLRLGGASTLGVLDLGINTAGGSLTVLSGGSLSIVNSTGNLRVGVSGVATAASGTLDASAAASFTASVANVQIGLTGNNNVSALGVLNLAASNDITASASFVVGNSGGAQNNVTSSVAAPANSSTIIRTPSFVIGASKSRGTFTLGAGATFDLTGIGTLSPTTGRASFGVSSMNAGGGSGTYTGSVDVSAGLFRANLNGLFIGNNNTASSSSSSTGVLTLGANLANHLDIVGAGNVVVVGRQQVSTATGVATGTLTIGGLDSTSSVTTTTAGATAILVGSALTAGKAVGTLNLNGGTLSINTTGAAIGGSALGTSTVNFNGTTIRSLASSATWVSGLTTANVGAGGAKFDTNGFSNTISQPLLHDSSLDVPSPTADGGLTKSSNGTLTLSATNTYTGPTVVNGGILQAVKTASLPGYNVFGQISVFGSGGLGVNAGGAGEWTAADIETLRTNAFFSQTPSLAIDTTNAVSGFTYGSAFNSRYSLTKAGANTLTLDTGATTLGSLNIGINGNGGTVALTAGQTVSVGTGSGENLNIGVTSTTTAATGTLNILNAASFTANVANVIVGSAQNNGVTGLGTLNLPANSTITAGTSFVVGNSAGAFNNVTSAVTIEPGGTTTIQTPLLTIGGTKSRGTFTGGAGGLVTLTGTFGGRTALSIGRSAIEGGSGNWSGAANFTAGIFQAQLNSLVIGFTDAGTGSWTVDGSLLMSANPGNHIDISGAANPVQLGHWLSGAAATTGGGIAATGLWTIGNLDATSSITATDNSTAILVGSGGVTGTQRATGTLNLNGGALTITTAGTAIGGDPLNTSNISTVSFNGTTLKAGLPSTSWISNLSNAIVSTGGAKFDTNGNDITIPQALNHDGALVGADGGLTKTGAGTLALTGVNGYNGPTAILGGALQVNGSISGTVSVANGTLSGTGSALGAVTVSTSGAVATGSSGIGTLITGPLTFSGGGTLAVEIDTALVASDLLLVSGALNLGLTAPSLSVTDLGGDLPLAMNTKFTIATYSGGWDGNLFQVNGSAVSDGGIVMVGSTIYSLDYNDGGSNVTLTVVPEPLAGMSLLGGLGLLLARRRRRA